MNPLLEGRCEPTPRRETLGRESVNSPSSRAVTWGLLPEAVHSSQAYVKLTHKPAKTVFYSGLYFTYKYTKDQSSNKSLEAFKWAEVYDTLRQSKCLTILQHLSYCTLPCPRQDPAQATFPHTAAPSDQQTAQACPLPLR